MSIGIPMIITTIVDSIRADPSLVPSGQVMPICINPFGQPPQSIGAGTWLVDDDNTLLYGTRFRNTTSNDGDNFTYNFAALAGTYTIRFLAAKRADLGIVDVDLDGVEIGSFDLYAAVTDPDNIEEITGVVLAEGTHSLRFRLDGMNVASTNFRLFMGVIAIIRTA